jgi:hypothetical protein
MRWAIVFLVLWALPGMGQDSLSVEQLAPLTRYFEIENGRLKGEGGDFMREILSEAQFTMIGEYHGSARISEFTEALIPILHEAGYRTMALEVGPVTGEILNQLDGNLIDTLKEINSRYLIPEEDYINPPIPLFESVEDARFLEKAKSGGWNVFGIDQEFLYGYTMLLDAMYANLSEAQKVSSHDLYQEALDSLKLFYEMDLDGSRDLAVSIRQSAALKAFTDAASIEDENEAIISALYKSNEIYYLYSQGQWFENNRLRIKYMKEQLRKALEDLNFDLSRDKLLIKTGGYHVSKGFSPLGLYEVGNTLNELAEYHGNTAVSIGFSIRFYTEEGEVKDMLDSGNAYRQRYRDLNQMGKEQAWAVIDLRPMVKGHFYRPVKYKFNEHIEELIKRFDLLIIPATEIDPTPNYRLD